MDFTWKKIVDILFLFLLLYLLLLLLPLLLLPRLLLPTPAGTHSTQMKIGAAIACFSLCTTRMSIIIFFPFVLSFCFIMSLPFRTSTIMASTDSFFLLSINFYDFLGKILGRFPVAGYMILNSEFSFTVTGEKTSFTLQFSP